MARRLRLFLSTKDIEVLNQVTDRTARTYLKKMRTVFDKEPYQPITVAEYATYMNVPEEDVLRVLNDEMSHRQGVIRDKPPE